MKSFLSVFVFVFIFFSNHAQDTLSLRQCVEQAIEENLQLQKQQLIVAMLTNQHKMAQSGQLPDLNASMSSGLYFGRFFSYDQLSYVNDRDTYVNADLSTNVTLFQGLYHKNNIAQKEMELEASKEDLQAQSNNIALEIVNNYLQVIYNREQFDALTVQIDATQKQIERTGELAKAGSVPQGDVLELKAQMANEKSQITAYKNLERQAMTNLRQAMNSMDKEFDVEKPGGFDVDSLFLGIPVLSEVYNSAIKFLPEVRSAEKQMNAKMTAIEVAKSAYYPTMQLHGSVSTRYNKLATPPGNTDATYSFKDQMVDYGNSVVGISLNIPIFNRFQTKFQVQNAQIDFEMANRDLDITKINVYKSIETALNDARAAYDNYKAAEENVNASKESFRYAEQKFNAGLMNSVDYNLAKSNLIKARASLVSARFELIFKVKIIDFYMGKDIEL